MSRARYRVLVLCTHNAARSQMAEGWIRALAQDLGVSLEVWSAGTEPGQLRPEAVDAMAEVGIDLGGHRSKSVEEVPEPDCFDVVLTVCDSARESCPLAPGKATDLHVSVPDPTGESLEEWRRVRDGIGRMARALVQALGAGRKPTSEELAAEAGLSGDTGRSQSITM